MNMKTIPALQIICSLALSGSLLSGCTASSKTAAAALEEQPDTLNIAVATDLHFLSSSLTDHGSAFEKYITNSDGKTMEYSEELVDAFLSEVIAEKPHVLVLTGDLTYNGEKQSHVDLSRKLQAVEDAGIQVCVILGNHDMYNKYAVSFSGDSYSSTDTVTSEEFEELYSDYGYSEALARDPDSLSYVYQCSPSTRLLFVDVNASEYYNTISDSTLQWIEEQLQQAQQDGVKVIGFSHQNMLRQSIFGTGFVIENASSLEKLYEQYGVLANFSGHLHIQHTKTGTHNVPEAVTSSLAVSPNQYAEISLTDSTLDYATKSVDVSAWAKANNKTDENLLNFSTYSKTFFDDNSYRTAYEDYESLDNVEEIAEYFTMLNNAYFQGRASTLTFNSALNNQINQFDDNLSTYIISIRQEKTDMNVMHIDF